MTKPVERFQLPRFNCKNGPVDMVYSPDGYWVEASEVEKLEAQLNENYDILFKSMRDKEEALHSLRCEHAIAMGENAKLRSRIELVKGYKDEIAALTETKKAYKWLVCFCVPFFAAMGLFVGYYIIK